MAEYQNKIDGCDLGSVIVGMRIALDAARETAKAMDAFDDEYAKVSVAALSAFADVLAGYIEELEGRVAA
jgi:hypothetical protein